MGCLLNLALVAQKEARYTECFGWCDKALRQVAVLGEVESSSFTNYTIREVPWGGKVCSVNFAPVLHSSALLTLITAT